MAGKRIGVWMSGTKKVVAAIQERSLKGRKDARVDVGYSAPYATFQHENLLYNHPVGRAKFLEEPARVYSHIIADIVKQNLQNKESLETAVLRAGNWLLSVSQQIVPVDTGALRASGYVKLV
jgi:hypothetical protein